MKRTGFVVLLATVTAIFAAVVLYLFNRRFAGGDAYPPYSSLRTDPVGARLIFDSLERLPGVTVTRSYLPLERLSGSDGTVLFLGMEPHGFAMQGALELQNFEKLAARGNRLVLALAEQIGADPPRPAPLEKAWGVRMTLAFDEHRRALPYFADAKNWNVVARDGTLPQVIERPFGKGTIVLVADGRMFANDAVAVAKQTALLAQVIGGHKSIVFDEAHFGFVESGSVVALARRYRMHGLALGLAIVAMLFIWKNASSFPPSASVTRESTVLGRTSLAGLVTLLDRHIAPGRLTSACWQEWLKSHGRDISAARRAQAEDVLRREAADPVQALRDIQTIVRTKGAI